MSLRTSLIIPAYNEEKGLPLVIEEYADKVDEIIVVDDGSSDRTFEVAKRYEVQVYKHETNRGKVAALRTGVEHATGDVIIFTDADYTYPARYVPEFISAIEKGADLVLGSRLRIVQNMPLLNRIGNHIFSFFAAYISCMHITDSQTGYRAFRREMFEKLNVVAKSLEFETKMTVRAAKLGYKIVEVPIEYRERVGKSKLRPIRDGFKMLVALLSVAFSETSLLAKMIMLPALIFIFVGLVTGLTAIYEQFALGGVIHSYYPILTTFLILIAIQLISIGLIIDYLTKKLDRIEERLLK
jgi:glycosyltransferase involved in cell wall biosynthesis